MEQVRLAVIGCGNQCTRQLMPGIPRVEEIDLVAVCDLQEALARRNARNFGAGAWYTDFQKMLTEEKPDAVAVVGPPEMHEELGIACFEAGCHVFTEKPSSPTVEGARRLAEAGVRAGKRGQIGHMMRHAEAVRLAWDLSHAEGFGKILSVESKYTTWPTGTMAPGRGWGEPDSDWTYMLVQGGHPIDLIRHFLGPVVRVFGRCARGAGNAKVYQVTVEGANGEAGFLNLQDSYNGWSTKLEIVGDSARTITVDDLGSVTFRSGQENLARDPAVGPCPTAQTWEPHFITKSEIRAGYQSQIQAFARFILKGEEPFPSLVDGWRNLVVAECIVESCRANQAVAVPQDTLA